MSKKTIFDQFPVGRKFKATYFGNYEVRAIIDNEYFAVKTWASKKRRYTYEIHHWTWIEMLLGYDRIK